jgi:hypothetical protein
MRDGIKYDRQLGVRLDDDIMALIAKEAERLSTPTHKVTKQTIARAKLAQPLTRRARIVQVPGHHPAIFEMGE